MSTNTRQGRQVRLGERFPSWRQVLLTTTRSRTDADGETHTSEVIQAVPANVSLILEHDPNLRGSVTQNALTGAVELTGILGGGPRRDRRPGVTWNRAVLDASLGRTAGLEDYLATVYAIRVSASVCDQRLRAWAELHQRHPIREYLEDLRWDGEKRLERLFFDYWTANPQAEDAGLWAAYGTCHLVAAVARVFRPGCKVDTMLILQGAQGIGKSSGIRALCPEDAWFLDSPIDFRSKEGSIALRGRWHVEIAELDSFRRAEQTAVKRFLSQPQDQYRPPYGRETITVDRQCVIWGTTNETGFFSDPTGARRFWVVPVAGCNVDRLKTTRDQLWAEAVHLYRQGTDWWLGEDLTEAQAAAAVQWEETDPWHDAIRIYLAQRSATDLMEVWTDCLKGRPADLRGINGNRIAQVLRTLGWVRDGRFRVPRGQPGAGSQRTKWVR